jgi:DNA-binding PadR family transcriptional regulator
VRAESAAGALRSEIAWALLGLVIERPSYGYELIQRFQRSYGQTLALSGPGRIYTAIEALSLRSLIEEASGERGSNGARVPKLRYRATEPGVHAYQDWLLTQLQDARHRQRLFARQLAMLEPESALGVIDRYERECLAESEIGAEVETAREGIAARLAEEEESLALQVRLSWIGYARGELSALLERGELG